MPWESCVQVSMFLIWSLILTQERIEFNEGDIGLTGGIQILEPATLNPTTDESEPQTGARALITWKLTAIAMEDMEVQMPITSLP